MKKHKTGKRIKNNYSTTANFWKPKYQWQEISYYGTSKNFFSKIKRQTEMVPLAIYTFKQKNLDEKYVKIT